MENVKEILDVSDQEKERQLKKLRESEMKFKNAVSFAHLLIWDYDPVSQSFLNDNGWIEDMGLKNFVSHVPESLIEAGIIAKDSVEEYRQLFRKIELGFEHPTGEVWIYDQVTGKRTCVRITYTVEKERDGIVSVAHGIAQDITEMKIAEEEYKSRMNSIFRMNADAVSNFSGNITKNWCGDGRSVYENIAKLQQKGTIDGFIEDAMIYIRDQKEQQEFQKTFNRKQLLQSFENGITRVSMIHHYLLEEGREEWVRSSLEMIKNPVSGDIEAGFYTTNIHHSKVMNTMFRSVAQREYDLIAAIYTDTGEYMILDHENDYVIQKKTDYETHQMNRMKGVLYEDEEKSCILERFTWKNILEEVERAGEYILTFSTYDKNRNFRRKKLRYSYIEKERHIMLMTCRDITDLYLQEKKQEKELEGALEKARQASQAKSEFLSRVSHDIRTPLNGITGMLQLAKMEDNMEQIHEDMEQASTSAEFLLGLINDILDMSKIEAGKVELKLEPYEFAKFSEYLNVVIRPLCRKRALEFTVVSEEPDTTIMVDKLRFNQIFFNLLSNSAKYTMPGGKVSLECRNYRRKGKKTRIDFYVRDNGIGMSREFQKHLFQMFTQEYRDVARGTEGTGLGLAITKSLVDLMGGTIQVESKINQGSEFKVTLELPMIEKEETERMEQEKRQKNTHRKLTDYDFCGMRILLCEDNKINQQIAVRLLEKAGAEVDVAGNGKEGLELFESSKEREYALILMDIRMPIMDGLTTARKIRELSRADAQIVPIIAMTRMR